MLRWQTFLLLGVIFAAALTWVHWHNSPMREIERSKAAIGAVKSWHYHSLRYSEGSELTYDVDTLCPTFQHTVVNGTDSFGTPMSQDYINYFGTVYRHADGQWLAPRGGRQSEIFECLKKVVIGADATALPFEAIVSGAKVQRGATREVNGSNCTDYEIAYPTPDDPQEKEFQFSMCINEDDHLPRETRRMLPGSNQETIATYSGFNTLQEPDLPPEISTEATR